MSSSIDFSAIDCWNNVSDLCDAAPPPDYQYNWNEYQEQETLTMELPPYHRMPLLDERGHEARTGQNYLELEPSYNWEIGNFDNYLNPTPQCSQATVSSDFSEFSEFFPNYEQDRLSSCSSTYSPISNNSPSPPPSSDPYDLAARRYKAMMAARKARARKAETYKKAKEDEIILQKRNIELKTTLTMLEQQVENYKKMLLLACNDSGHQNLF